VRSTYICVALAAAIIASRCANAATNARWFTLSVDGVRTGYAREEQRIVANENQQSETVTLFVRELGHDSRMQRHIEFRSSAAGKPLAFDYELTAGTVHQTLHATFSSDKSLKIATSPADQSIDLPGDTLFTPDRSERFAALWKHDQSAIDLLIFDPVRRTSGHVRANIIADTPTNQVHVRATSGASRKGAQEDTWFDTEGNIERIESNLLGTRLTWTPCEHECDAPVAQPVDPMDRLVVRSPVQIPDWFKHRKLRYVIVRSDGERPRVAQTMEQATVFDGARAVVTICDACGDTERPTTAELALYLASNAWVQNDDPEIHHLALNTVPHSASVNFRMRKLQELVVQRMLSGHADFLGYSDALTALHTGSGDCTEFALLLAALARAQGIPTRVVAGLAYSDRFSGKKDVFSPHAWVQAWDGARWRSYDAALNGFDSTHVALAVGSGDPGEFDTLLAQLPLLKIEKVGAVREN